MPLLQTVGWVPPLLFQFFFVRNPKNFKMRITGIDCHVLLVPDLREDATSSAQVDSPRHSLYLRFLAVVAFHFFILTSSLV